MDKTSRNSQSPPVERAVFAICEMGDGSSVEIVRAPSGACLIFGRETEAREHLRRSGVESRYRVVPVQLAVLPDTPTRSAVVDAESPFAWRTRAGLFSATTWTGGLEEGGGQG